MCKRMFEAGERAWPEEAPFHTPVFVVTHEARAPWVRKGGTTFHFVNDGIEDALRRAREVCGGKDVRISGGANLVLQYLNAGVVDELVLSVAPTFLAGGKRLFDGIDRSAVGLEVIEALGSPKVTHLRYAVEKRR
jgi:dihydrofolate reductase